MKKENKEKIDIKREIYFLIKDEIEKGASSEIYFSDICKISRESAKKIIEMLKNNK